ncbi:2-methoxy-6-polyprenyl-1,4-benzoquinol methylase, mitochondrial, partial [Stegodyphus mimosarum]
MISRAILDRFCKTLFRTASQRNWYKIVNQRCMSTDESQYTKQTHFFGFEEVTPSEKREKVQEVFTNVASKYDLMNDVMSVGIHRLWKDYFIQILSPEEGTQLLDVAGGTGDIAFRFLQASTDREHNHNLTHSFDELNSETEMENRSHVTVLDLNDKMLSICKDRAKEMGLHNYLTCIQGNAEILPFPENSFDAYTIAFGIRNVVHIDQALLEAHRVLRPGGRFLCLEFSEVKSEAFRRIYNWYSKEIIPVLGEIVAGDWKSYQYLIESIQKFPNQEEFMYMIEDAGFKMVTYENLCNGIAAIHSAYKL